MTEPAHNTPAAAGPDPALIAESVAFEATVEVQLVFTVTGEDWAPSRVAQEVQTLIDGSPTIAAVKVSGRRVQSLSYKVVD